MPKISPYSINTHLNGFLNSQNTSDRGANTFPHWLGVESFLKGATATVAGEFYTYEENSYTGETISAIKVIVDCVIDLDDGRKVIYGATETNCGVEKAYFNIDCVSAIDSSTAEQPHKCVRKCLSQVRREMRKANNKFPYAMFTPGTRCIVEVTDGPVEITVKSLEQTGPDHFCIDTGILIDTDNEFLKGMTCVYHTVYVTQVLEHKPGPLVIDRYRGHEIEDSTRDNNVRSQMSRKNGHSNRYSGSVYDIIRHAVNDLPNRVGQVYDIEKLINIMFQQEIFQRVRSNTFISHGHESIIFTANKKKVKRLMRRLHGKISANARKKQEEEDAQMNREMAMDFYD